MNRRSWVPFGAALACLVLACGGTSGRSGYAAAGTTGPEAPVSFADLDAIHRELSTHRGQPIFVNFWASWCVPCVQELPDLASLARESGAGGAVFLGVSLDAWVTGNGAETEMKVKRALAEAGVGYPNLIYRGDQDPLIEGFDLPGPIPYSVLYDPQGQQVQNWAGKAPIAEVRMAIAGASTRPQAGSRGR